jgi:protocatechuate 3,4-dioxygenase beta subunit
MAPATTTTAAPEATLAGATPAEATSQPPATAVAQSLPPTPACDDGDDATPQQTEGPFFTPASPERTSLHEPGLAGTPLRLAGYVLATNCQPIAGALLDFWHADDDGVYDNVGYRLRGHQFSDAAGAYALETIVPGLYTGRTRHIHVKVQAPGQPVLTTQLYFPGEPTNASDGIYDPALLTTVQEGPDGRLATFTFVLAVG